MIWQEPPRGEFPDPQVFMPLSGIDQMRTALRAGGPRPPIHYLTGLEPTEAGVGSATFIMPASEWLLVPQGLISGGALAILADAALGTAVQTTLPPSTLYTSADLSLSLVRPAQTGGLLIARARIIHASASLALAEVFVENSHGRLLAHGSSRCYVFPPAPTGAPEPFEKWVEPHYEGPHPYQRPALGETLPVSAWLEKSGLDVLRGCISGELPAPPIHHLTGLRPIAASAGECSFAMPASIWLCPPHGNIEGGAIALLADSALGGAVQTTVPAGQGYATLDVKVNFTRPVPPDGRDLLAHARVQNRGRNRALATTEVTREDGKRVAMATGAAAITGRPVTALEPFSPEDATDGDER